MDQKNGAPSYAAVKKWETMISFQFTGMDLDIQKRRLDLLKRSIPEKEVFSSMDWEHFFQSHKMSIDAIYGWCLAQQNACCKAVFLLAPGPESSGMKMELDRAKQLGQKIVCVTHRTMVRESWVRRFRSNASTNFTYDDSDQSLTGLTL